MTNTTEPGRKAPAFQFYADDFLAGTADMSAEEVGGYIRLLCHQWTKGGIPTDEDRAGRIAGLMGSPSLRYVLARFSPCPDGMLRNRRLEQVRQEQAAYARKQAESGKAGAKARWKNGNPNGGAMPTPLATPLAKGWPEDGSPSPSPSPVLKETHTTRACEAPDVEPPAGFPRTAADAVVHADFVGCPREFASDEWSRAMGRGGRDSKDVPIRNWRHYLTSSWASAQHRKAEVSRRSSHGRRNEPLPKSPDDAAF